MIERKIILTVSIPDDRMPWMTKMEDDGRERRYYQMDQEPFASLKGQPKSFGYNRETGMVDFIFYEGCDLDKIMLFKLAWV